MPIASKSFLLFRNPSWLQRKTPVLSHNLNEFHHWSHSFRRFHASPHKQSELLDICLSHTQTLIAGLHTSTGLPWIAALPLTAFLVRACLIAPLNAYSHQQIVRRLTIQPLLQAWSRPIAIRINKKHGALGEAICKEMAARDLRKKSQQLQRSLGLSHVKQYAPLIHFPIWLVFMETIRKMCGTHDGLFGLIAKSFSSSEADEVKDIASSIETSAVSVEPSMAFEGALWFPDLLVPDPMLMLPFMLSATMFGLFWHADRSIVRRNGVQTKWQIRLSRMSKLFALAIGPLTLQLPSAMLIYWMSSSLTALCQSLLFERFLPYPPPVRPCKPK